MFKILLSFLTFVSAEGAGQKIDIRSRNLQNTRQFWAAGGLEDKYPNVTDITRKLLHLNETSYEEYVFDSAKAKYVADKPYFLTFINTRS